MKKILYFFKEHAENIVPAIAIIMLFIVSIVSLVYIDKSLPLWNHILDIGGNILFIIGMSLAMYYRKKNSLKQSWGLLTVIVGVLAGSYPYIMSDWKRAIFFIVMDVFLLALAVVLIYIMIKEKQRAKNKAC